MRESNIVLPVSALRRALVVFIVVLALGGVLLFALQQRESLGGILARGVRDQIDPNAYQAVFLTGGQVYFGKLTARGDDHYLLSDVFYLSPGDAQQTADPQRPGQLIKRGAELHGPREPMIIPARSVLFIENVREDAQVGQAIRRFKAGEIPTATPTPPRTPASPAATPRPSPTR